MNKHCTNPSCRKTFSTLNYGGQCPFCGKIYPDLESRRKNAVAVKTVSVWDRMTLKIRMRKSGYGITVHVRTDEVVKLLRMDEKIKAIKVFREEMKELGFIVGLKSAKEFVDSVITDRPIVSWHWTGLVREGSREIVPANESTGARRTEKKRKALALAMNIEDLDLSVRAYNCLKRADITTVRDLAACSEEDLKGVRNLGMKSREEIIYKLSMLGLGLRPDGTRGRKPDAAAGGKACSGKRRV